MNVTFDHAQDIATGIKTFWFKPERPANYVAGQFTELYLHHENPDNRGEKRWFTLSSSPTEPMLSITTRFAAENGSTFKQALRALEPGTNLNLAEAMGDFVLPKSQDIPILFVAGGMGITPMRSMVKYLVDSGEKRPIQLLYGVNNDNQLAFLDLFEKADIQFMPLVKEPSLTWKGEIGSIDVNRVLEIVDTSKDMLVYLSGPEVMTKLLADTLKKSGMEKHRIITDFFPGYSQL